MNTDNTDDTRVIEVPAKQALEVEILELSKQFKRMGLDEEIHMEKQRHNTKWLTYSKNTYQHFMESCFKLFQYYDFCDTYDNFYFQFDFDQFLIQLIRSSWSDKTIARAFDFPFVKEIMAKGMNEKVQDRWEIFLSSQKSKPESIFMYFFVCLFRSLSFDLSSAVDTFAHAFIQSDKKCNCSNKMGYAFLIFLVRVKMLSW